MDEGKTERQAARILVVDDSSANLQLLTDLLQEYGYTVHPASDGGLALEFVRNTLPDLILLDIRMPGMDGYELCRRLKAEERTRDIPVIFISILEDELDKVQGFQSGAVDFITKPFQPAEVLARTRTHLRLRELTERLECRVAESTEELMSANQRLVEEVAERGRAEEEIRQNLTRQKALLELYQKMADAQIQEIIAFVVDRCVTLTGSAIGFVGLLSNDDLYMEAYVWSEKAMESCSIDKPSRFTLKEAGLWAEPIRQRREIIVNDYSASNPLKRGCPEGHLPLKRFMGIPVVDNNRVVAVAAVANRTDAYAETDLNHVSLLLQGMWDLIKRKRAEEALRHERSFIGRITETSPVGITLVNNRGEIIFANHRAELLFGLTKEEITQRSYNAPQWRITDFDGNVFPEEELPFVRVIASGEPVYDVRHAIEWPDGRRVFLSINGAPLFGETGEVENVVFTVEDVTERKRAEAAYRASVGRFEELFNKAAVPLCLVNKEEGTLHFNVQFEKTFGYSHEDVPTLDDWWRLAYPDPTYREQVCDTCYASLQRALKDGTDLEPIEYQVACKNGDIRSMVVFGSFIGRDLLLTFFDISERKEAERERMANLAFFEAMDKVNRSIQGVSDLEQMMQDMLDVVLSIFNCDRSFLLYPCDPEAPTWQVPMECTRLEHSGLLELGAKMKMDPEVSEVFRILLAADGPVTFGLDGDHAQPRNVSRQFGIKSGMSMAVYPKSGKPWQVGVHQCTYDRIWTTDEKKLFQEIGRRLSDALNTLLSYRDLRKNEEFLNNIVEHIPNMIFVKDAETLEFVRFNRAGEQLLGYSREELLGKTDYDFFPQEIADFFTGKDRQVLASKKLLDIPEETIRNRRNEERILHTQKIPIPDDSGTPRYLLGISEDITEQKQAEEKMLRSDQRLRLHQELSPLGFLEWDENFRAVEWNAACERIFGYTREEAIGRHAKELILPEKVHGLVDGIYRSLMNRTGGQHSINENVTKDGRTIICEWFNTSLMDENGKAIGVSSICSDITEKKKAEESIRKLSQAIEQSPVSIVITDTEGSIEFVNSKFSQITGYTSAEVLGRNPRILKSGETSAKEYRQLWNTISSGGIWEGEFHNRKKNGELFWEHATIAPIRNADNIITHYVAVKEDITERKKLEGQLRQVQKMEAVGTLAGGIAHDFNNILTAIIGYGYIMKNKIPAEDPLAHSLDHILLSAERASRLTQGLLAFSREQASQPRPVNLNDIVRNVEQLLRRIIGEDISLVTEISSTNLIAMADPTQIEQVLINFATNARDAMPSGGRLTLSTREIELREDFVATHGFGKPGRYTLISVSDTGKGMDEKTKEHIFDPFFTTKETGKGTGLGLAIVYGIVKQQNGTINVYSEPGKGTTFRVYLPLVEVTVEKATEKPMPAPRGGPETILVAEDDDDVRYLTLTVLQYHGYRVIEAVDGDDAIARFKERSTDIDLLISDVIMPRKSGMDAYKAIRAMNPGVSVLFISGYTADMLDRKEITGDGVHFISKPVSPSDLLRKVREILDTKKGSDTPPGNKPAAPHT